MKILLVTGSNIMGGEYHRLIIPHAKMHLEGVEVSQIPSIDHYSESELQKFDIIIASRAISRIKNDLYLWDIVKRLNIPVIIDTDDHYKLNHSHIIKRDWLAHERAKSLIYNFKNADSIITTNNYLKTQLKDFNKEIEVFPNVIDFEQSQFIPNHQVSSFKTDLVHIGWSGSVTHLEDLRLIEPELLSLNKSKEKDYKLMLAGYYEGDATWDKYEKIFTSNYILGDENYGRINAANVYSYAQAYNLFDIGIIPLRDNEFNRAKSDLKLLEMGAFGLPCIVSDIEVYKEIGKHGVNCLFSGKKDWYKSIRKLIENPSLRKELGENLRNDVLTLRNEKTWRKKRLEYYQFLIDKKRNI